MRSSADLPAPFGPTRPGTHRVDLEGDADEMAPKANETPRTKGGIGDGSLHMRSIHPRLRL